MIGNIQSMLIRRISKIKFLYDIHVRSICVQVAILLLIIYMISWIVGNIYNNMEKSNIVLGIKFLQERAGFEIDQGIMPYTGDNSYAMALVVGFVNTFTVAFLGIIPATLIGIVVGTGRLSKNKLASWICRVYVELFRNIPPLVVIFFWYRSVLSNLPSPENSIALPFGIFLNNRGISLPSLIMDTNAKIILFTFLLGIILSIVTLKLASQFHKKTGQILPVLYISIFLIFGLPAFMCFAAGFNISFEYPILGKFNFVGGYVIIPEFMSLYLALSFYTASFIAEIVRLGLISVPPGQMEAAIALGLNPRKATRLVVLPQAMRVIIPPLTSQYLNLLKNSSLAVAVGFVDLVSVGGTIINQTGQAIEIIIIWMSVYLSLSIVISMFMNWLNKKIALTEKR
ncbi:MAG: amino acid ABC transporter permease [Candidatus Liberibacter europaeus]|uniref:Amino acid ABC transporter permease n=1 Tax=Candidatus Liberibacter europaeus TaxID=744859 RepID=A0A2T4VX67_9HYPH|nr:amino acid ABC transporter permease [Candidatus Liberibacter europaeus]PTL86367.1 MAG: amino acid ABC transporter permease [Candidatus Liberibacter europaeus]